MSNTEERRFVLNFFNFVFTAHDRELPPIFTETYPNVTYTEDTHLTPVMRQGIMDVIETQNIASRRAATDAAADYWLRLVMNSYNEEHLLNFICFHAWNCLVGNLDAASMIDEFELVMNVLRDAKISKKFTAESWEKLDAEAARSSSDAENRREAEFLRLHHGKPYTRTSSSSSPSPERHYEPVAKKPRTDLPSTLTSAEEFEAGPSSVKPEKLDTILETDGKTEPEKSEMQEKEGELKETEKRQSADEETEAKKLRDLKISKEVSVQETTSEKDSKKVKELQTDDKSETKTEEPVVEEKGVCKVESKADESEMELEESATTKEAGTSKISKIEESEMMQEAKFESSAE